MISPRFWKEKAEREKEEEAGEVAEDEEDEEAAEKVKKEEEKLLITNPVFSSIITYNTSISFCLKQFCGIIRHLNFPIFTR